MKFYNYKLFTFLFALLCFSFVTQVNAQKISAEEIIAKHLESIGTKENRAAVKNQVIFNSVEFRLKGSSTTLNGRSLILSSGQKNLWGMNFESNAYPEDKFSYNGKNTKVAFTKPGDRSIIGDFIFTYNELLKDGLLGGTLSNSWTLLNNDTKKSKSSYDGTKAIDGKDAYVLSYSPKGGTDLNIKMYFDRQTFQHIRTEYNRLVAARQGGSVDGSAGQGEDRYRVTEEFSKFAKMGDLTLPSVYKLSYSYSSSAALRISGKSNREVEWTFNVVNYSFNQQLEDTSFDVNVK